MIPTRDFQILLLVALYDTLIRSQITRLLPDLFQGAHPDRITRKRLGVLTHLDLLNVTTMRTVNPSVQAGVSAPVFFMSAKGNAFLAQETGDERYFLCNTTTPHHLYLYHFIAVAETHMILRKACDLLGDVSVAEWIGERSIANPNEKDPAKRFRLYTRFHEKLCCVPDAGFLLKKGDFAKAFFLEQDRDTTKSAERVAAQKCGGYAALAENQLHLKRLFPAATWPRFNALMIAPTPRRRDALRKAINTKPGAGLWKFAALTELTPESFLTGSIWYKCGNDTPSSLLLKEGQ
jgi:Replication-relaxation